MKIGEKYLLHSEHYDEYVILLHHDLIMGCWVRSEEDGEMFWADAWELSEVE